MRRSALWLGMILALAFPAPAFGQDNTGLVVSVSPPIVDTTLGSTVDVEVTVTNEGSTAVTDFAVHLDITDPSLEGSVDPEDWTATLTRPGATLEPGEALVQTWPLQPISGGRFTVYAVALTPGSTEVPSSNAVEFRVEERRALNPEGVLPVAVGGPLIVGLLLGRQWRRGRAPLAATH